MVHYVQVVITRSMCPMKWTNLKLRVMKVPKIFICISKVLIMNIADEAVTLFTIVPFNIDA